MVLGNIFTTIGTRVVQGTDFCDTRNSASMKQYGPGANLTLNGTIIYNFSNNFTSYAHIIIATQPYLLVK